METEISRTLPAPGAISPPPPALVDLLPKNWMSVLLVFAEKEGLPDKPNEAQAPSSILLF
jgi:hypothetical protein